MTLTRLALTAIVILPVLAAFIMGFILGRYKIEVKRVQITGSTVDRFKKRMDAPKPIGVALVDIPKDGEGWIRLGWTLQDCSNEELLDGFSQAGFDADLEKSQAYEKELRRRLAERDLLAARVRELESQLGDTLKAMDGE